ASNRPGGEGDFDLWLTHRVPIKSAPAVAAAASPSDSTKKKRAKSATTDSARAVPVLPAGPSPFEILTSPYWEWTPPENLGPSVNSSVAEESPTVSADGLTLIFSSLRP